MKTAQIGKPILYNPEPAKSQKTGKDALDVILHFNWKELQAEHGLKQDEIVVKLVTKEKLKKYNKAKKDESSKTHTGTPEIGAARHFYEKAMKKHVTALRFFQRNSHGKARPSILEPTLQNDFPSDKEGTYATS